MQGTSFFPNISTLPEQFAALIDLQARALEELRILNKVVPVVPADLDHKPRDFDIPSTGYSLSRNLLVTALLVSCDVGGLVKVFRGENYQWLTFYMAANSTLLLSWPEGDASEIGRGLLIKVTVAAGNVTAHMWGIAS